MSELEKLREDVNRLTARSWAQEAVLLFLAQRAGGGDFGFVLDVDGYSQQLRDHLRHSPLTDSQLAHFDVAMRALLERLHRLEEKPSPWETEIPN